MNAPWFFATTPAPRPAVPERRPVRAAAQRRWLHRLALRYIAWAEHSHEQLGGSRML